MWVAVELATLTTVLMVGIYRTPEALEAAWKYFILGSVGIALALFGTILLHPRSHAADFSAAFLLPPPERWVTRTSMKRNICRPAIVPCLCWQGAMGR